MSESDPQMLVRSGRQREKDKRSLVGALFKAGQRDSALALIRNQITPEEAVERLR